MKQLSKTSDKQPKNLFLNHTPKAKTLGKGTVKDGVQLHTSR